VPPCEQQHKINLPPLEIGGAWGERYLPQTREARFLFLEGSGAVAATLITATAALADASAALAGASVARTASSTDRPAAGTSAPAAGACSSATFAALGDGGGGFHLLGEARPPSLSSFSSSSNDELSRVAGERVPAARAAGTPRPAASGAPAAGFSSPSYAPPSLAPTAARRGRPPGHGAPVDLTVRRSLPPSANGIKITPTRHEKTKRKGEAYLPAGSREA
jgi:hypothetical protein